MGIDYALKYETQINEMFREKSMTDAGVNSNYDFEGVRTVKVYAVPTVDMNDYEMAGFNRYGQADELTATVQEMTLKKDRSFTFTIDKRNNSDTQGAIDAGTALGRQIEQVIVPEIDKYRLKVMAEGAGIEIEFGSKGAYEALLEVSMLMTDSSCPLEGRVAFVSAKMYKELKLDDSFIKNTEIAQTMLITGQVGMVDNIKIVVVPGSYLPKNAMCIIVHNSAITAAQKLNEYKIHDNPPGINGWLIEGRVCYDAFVLENRELGIGVVKGQ